MKTQCTKKERGTGALKELMELAGAIDQFAYEYDTYKYMDQVDDSEEHVLSIMNDLKKGNTEKLASYFKSIMEDHKAFVKRAEDILAQIEGFASGQKMALESGDADSGSGEDRFRLRRRQSFRFSGHWRKRRGNQQPRRRQEAATQATAT